MHYGKLIVAYVRWVSIFIIVIDKKSGSTVATCYIFKRVAEILQLAVGRLSCELLRQRFLDLTYYNFSHSKLSPIRIVFT